MAQVINLLAAVLLMLAFAMISQRRILSLIHLFTLQGVTLVAATAVVGYVTHQPHLYLSAGITLLLKVILIPVLLHRVIDRLNVRWDVETLINIPTTMLVGIRVGHFRLQPCAADRAPFIVHRPRHAGNCAGLRAALVPDDDHRDQRRCRKS